MIVDPSVVGEFGSQVRREHIRKVGVLDEDLCRSLFGDQASYLRPMGRVDICIERGGIEGCDERDGTEGHDVNYVGLMFRVKYCSCKHFFLD